MRLVAYAHGHQHILETGVAESETCGGVVIGLV